MTSKEKILFLHFNQDHSLFICSLESGVRIYNVDPLVEVGHLHSKDIGTMAVAELFYKTDLITCVSGGAMPKFADNAVMVYKCDGYRKFVSEYTYSTPVIAVTFTKSRLITAHRREVNVFAFPHSDEPLNSFETRDNPLGLLAATPGKTADRAIICFPAKKCGAVRIVDLASTDASVSQPPIVISAHDNELACMSMNQEGNLLATASQKGTLIRVWDTIRRVKVAELRRGTDPATLYCINFSGDSDFLCCSSDKGTVHIFAVKDTRLNRRSTLSGITFLGDYVESQWALANFTVPPESACICAFGANSSIYAICFDGSFHKYVFTAEGHCNRVAFDMFPDICDHWDF